MRPLAPVLSGVERSIRGCRARVKSGEAEGAPRGAGRHARIDDVDADPGLGPYKGRFVER